MTPMNLLSDQPPPQQVGSTPMGPNDLRRRLAMQLLQQGSSGDPVQHWAQGANRVAQAVMGGLELGQADQSDREERKALATALNEAQTGQGEGGVTMGQGGRAAAIARVLGSPMATPGQQQLAQSLATPTNSQIITRPDGSVMAINPRTLEQRQLAGVSAQPPSYGVIGQDVFGNSQYGFIDPVTRSVQPMGGRGMTPASGAPSPQPSGAPVMTQPRPMAPNSPGMGPTSEGSILTGQAPSPVPVAPPSAAPASAPAQPGFGGIPGLPEPPPGVNPRVWLQQYSERQAAQGLPASNEDEARLRGEAQRLPAIQRVQTAIPIFNSMISSAGMNTRAGDLDFVYGLAKIFDPESVVREGEMTMVRQTGAIPDQIMGYINAVTQGGQQLTPQQRRDLLDVSSNRVGQLQSSATAEVERYRGIAARGRANPENVLPSMPAIDQPALDRFRDIVSPRNPQAVPGQQQPSGQPALPQQDLRARMEAELRRRNALPGGPAAPSRANAYFEPGSVTPGYVPR